MGSGVDLILTLQARSMEMDTHELYVRISRDGEWEDGENEMTRHMVVKEVDVKEDGTLVDAWQARAAGQPNHYALCRSFMLSVMSNNIRHYGE